MTNQEIQDQLRANEKVLNKQGVSLVAIAIRVKEVTDGGIKSSMICSFSIPTDNEMMNCGNVNAGIDYATMSNRDKVLNLTKQAMIAILRRIPESSHPQVLFQAAKEAYILSISEAINEADQDGDSAFENMVQKIIEIRDTTLEEFATKAARGALEEAAAYKTKG